MKHVYKNLARWMKFSLACLIAISGLGAYLVSYWPVLLGKILDEISIGRINSISTGAIPFLMLGVVILGAEALNIGRRVSADLIVARFEERLRSTYNSKVMRLKLDYLNGQRSSTEIVTLLGEAVAGAGQLMKLLANDLLSAVLVCAFMIMQAVIGAPIQIALVLIGYLVLSIAVSYVQIRSQQGIRVKIIAGKAKLNGSLAQGLDNIEFIRVNSFENFEARRQLPAIHHVRSVESKHHLWMGSFDLIKQIVKVFTFIALLFMSVGLISSGAMSAGTAITIILLFQSMVAPVETFYRFLDEISASLAKAKMFSELHAQGDDPVFLVPNAPANTFSGNSILFDKVSILSPETGKVLSVVEHERINSSAATAVQGKSGSGKSCLARALLGYYPHKGTITVFGVPQSMISKSQLSEFISYIPQGKHFFIGSIKENLAYGLDMLPSDEQFLQVLEKACLKEELEGRGLNALEVQLEEGASGLSGGQAQRLKLARAFLLKPRLFIFDEPDTGLDDATTQKALQNLLDYAREIGAGVVFISHKESVLELCDNRIVIRKPTYVKAA